MENLQLILFILVFFLISFLMFLRKLPALIALPLMAVLIAFIGGISFDDILKYVIGQGATKLSTAYTVAMFGSMLSVLVQKTNIAENFIKKGAELSGDNPWFIALIMLLLIISLFTTLGGLGALIMVATIVLPIMTSVGMSQITTVGIFLIGLSIGGILNVGNWAVYMNVMGLSVDEIRSFALIIFGISFTMSLVYITIQLYKDGHDLKIKKIILNILSILFTISLIYVIYSYVLSETLKLKLNEILSLFLSVIKNIIKFGLIVIVLLSFLRLFNKKKDDNKLFWGAYFTPIIPLILILIFNVDFIAAFISGILFGFLSTYKKGSFTLLIRVLLEGGGLVMPAVVLMFGIGMLLNALMGPGGVVENYPDGWPVQKILQPLFTAVIPKTPLSYILTFSIAAPLALYRGPLNVWGMGYGLAAIMLSSGLNPGAVMGVLLAVGQIQSISDPTNTHNVWLANEMRVDVQKILWNTIPYTWIVAILGIIASALIFMK